MAGSETHHPSIRRFVFADRRGAGESSPDPPRLMNCLRGSVCFLLCAATLAVNLPAAAAETLKFERDTFAFSNETFFMYEAGRMGARNTAAEYAGRCFVMTRSVIQFRKFARFDPAAPPLDDDTLAGRVRSIAARAPWRGALPEERRIVIPGVADLRTLSRTRPRVLQENLGLGWPTYFRPGNWRVVFPKFPGQQRATKEHLDAALAEGRPFTAYLTTLPDNLNINHAVLPLARRGEDGQNISYEVYDPNHADAPCLLYWSKRDKTFWYPADETFIGGRVYVWQVYGGPLQ